MNERAEVDLGDVRVSCLLGGKPDGPALVLVHGGACDASTWNEIVAAFEGEYRIVAPELRGHGRSQWASAVVGLLKGSKIDEDRAHRMIHQFRDLRITRHQVEPLGDRLVKLRHNFTAYDAACIADTEVLRQPLLTCDAKFARAPSKSHAVEVHTFPG